MNALTALPALALALAAAAGAAIAQPYPSKAVKVIVPIAAGSGIDVVARAVSSRLQEEFGQPFIVENRAGAGTTTGASAVASAAPDGYTLLFHSNALTITPVTMAKLPYDVTRDLVGVMNFVNTPLILVSPPGRYQSIGHLVQRAKEMDGGMNYATIGYGAAAHFTTERLALAAGFKAQMVPFRGTAEAMTEVVAGRMDFYFTPATTAMGLIETRKLDALATTSRRRVADLPSVPTTLEAGYKDSDFDFWVGLLAPAKTPRDIIQALYERGVKVSKSTEFQKQVAGMGGELVEPNTPEQFDAFLKNEIERNRAIAKAAGIEAK